MSTVPPTATAAVPEPLLTGLNPEQREAVTTLTGPLLVVAGPGSGKTRVLVHRIAALLATGTWPSQILAVTFTNKAAAEMRERVAALVGDQDAARMWIATFHSACVRILRYHHQEAGLPRTFSIADQKDAGKLIGEVVAGQGITTGMTPAESRLAVRAAQSVISRAKNDGRTASDLAASRDRDIRDLAPVMHSYNERLAALGAVDFDDILLRTLELLRRHPEVTAAFQHRFAHILVDEYQDTNRVQYEITRLLAAGHHNLCVVGDADQSIYAFRGADPSVITAFTNSYPGAKVVALGQNYRSTSRIVEVTQAVIDPNPAVHRARLRTDNALGEPVRLYEADTSWAEARWVVAQIRSRGGSPADHAVLVRTNALTRALEQELTDHHLPYQVVGALRFYDRAEVKDALAYLRLAVNPADELAFERCVNTPKRGIGTSTVSAVRAEAAGTGRPVIDVVRDRAAGTTAAAAKLRGFLDVYEQVVAAANAGPAAALSVVADAAGLRAALRAATAKEGLDREGNLDELISYAHQFTAGGSRTDPEARDMSTLTGAEQTEAFLENVSLVSAAESATGDDPVAGTGQVSLLTMHAAKGKEYPHVYVIGLEDNILPHARALSSTSPEDLEEERRLMFVAVSRAQRTLDLSYCLTRAAFGKDVMNPPSRFLLDLPDDVELVRAAPGRWGGSRPAGRHGGFSPQRGASSSTPRRGPRPSTGASRPRTVVPGSMPRPAARPVPAALTDLAVGERVRHQMFGEGTVTAVTAHTATVQFTGGTRTLALAVAPLERAS